MASKHGYEIVAAAIRESNTADTRRQAVDRCDDMVRTIADHFARDNPRFDREKFLAACGYDPGDSAMW